MLPFHLPSTSWSKSTLSSLLGWLSSVSLYTSHKICPMAISNRVSSFGTVMEKLNCLRLLSRVIPPVSGGVTVLSKRYRSLYRNIRTFHLKHQNLLMKTSVSFGWSLYTYIYAYRSLHPLHASSSHTTRLSRRERNIPGGRSPFATTIPNFGYIRTDVYKFNAY